MHVSLRNDAIRYTDPFTGHIDWHLDTGLAVVLAEDPEDAASENPVPGMSLFLNLAP